MDRRRFLKTVPPTAVGVSLAGCTGGEIGGDGADGDWPPPGENVEMILPTDVGDSVDDLGRIWGSYLGEELGLDFTYTNNAGAGGMLANNETFSAPADGSVMGAAVYNTLVPNEIARDAAEYESTEFVHLKTVYNRSRACQLSPQTTHVDDHFDTDWEEFVDNAPYQIADTGVHHQMTHRFLPEFTDDLSVDDIESVSFDSGSDGRAAVERGDIDGYMGGFTSNLAPDRQEIYYTQWGVMDDQYPDQLEKLESYGDEAVSLGDIGYPEDGLEELVAVTIDSVGIMLPPDTSDEIVQQYDDAFHTLYDEREEEIREDIEQIFGESDTTYYEGTMEETEEFVEDKLETLTQYEDIIQEIFTD